MLRLLVAALLMAPPVPTGGLTFFPSDSIDTASIKARTSGGCPEPADGYTAIVTGHGFPEEGQTVVTPTAAGMARSEPFDVYFAQTMKDFAADNRTTLTGRYDVVIYCVDSFLGTKYGKFTGTLTFSSPTKYKASGQKTTTTNDVGPLAVAPPPASASSPAPASVAPAPGEGAPEQAATRQDSGPPVVWIVAGTAAVLLALEAGRRLGRRSTN